jgi:hypothetical protein
MYIVHVPMRNKTCFNSKAGVLISWVFLHTCTNVHYMHGNKLKLTYINIKFLATRSRGYEHVHVHVHVRRGDKASKQTTSCILLDLALPTSLPQNPIPASTVSQIFHIWFQDGTSIPLKHTYEPTEIYYESFQNRFLIFFGCRLHCVH